MIDNTTQEISFKSTRHDIFRVLIILLYKMLYFRLHAAVVCLREIDVLVTRHLNFVMTIYFLLLLEIAYFQPGLEKVFGRLEVISSSNVITRHES